jgi:hypothetical protein
MNELDTLKHKYQKAVETITNIHMEFLMAPKPGPAWMAAKSMRYRLSTPRLPFFDKKGNEP